VQREPILESLCSAVRLTDAPVLGETFMRTLLYASRKKDKLAQVGGKVDKARMLYLHQLFYRWVNLGLIEFDLQC
jgi:hypothetical protein